MRNEVLNVKKKKPVEEGGNIPLAYIRLRDEQRYCAMYKQLGTDKIKSKRQKTAR